MTIVARSWWSAPRPRRYLSNPVAVSALEYDGTDIGQSAVRRWVRRCTRNRPATVWTVEQSALVIDQPGADAVRVRPGEFLVLSLANGRVCWSSRSASRLRADFQALPLELPIYDDGENS